MELLSKLGIDGKLLLAQIVNFLVLLFILRRFAYKPVLAMLEKRSNKIEKGLKDAEDAKVKLEKAEEKEKEVLAKARKESQNMISKAEEMAKKNKEEIIIEAKRQSEKILAGAEKKIEEEKSKMMSKVKLEVASLVTLATEKIIDEKVDGEKDKDLINSVIK